MLKLVNQYRDVHRLDDLDDEEEVVEVVEKKPLVLNEKLYDSNLAKAEIEEVEEIPESETVSFSRKRSARKTNSREPYVEEDDEQESLRKRETPYKDSKLSKDSTRKKQASEEVEVVSPSEDIRQTSEVKAQMKKVSRTKRRIISSN